MSQTPPTADSCSPFQYIFDAALKAYTEKTGKDLTSHPLLAELTTCHSADAVLTALRKQIPGFDQSGSSDDRLTRWLGPTVNVLYAFSVTIGAGVGLVYSPAGMIFTGIGILLSAAKTVGASQGILVDLFERIEHFFRRLETYTEVPSTAAMTDIVVKIMVEVLSILAIATKEIERGRTKKFLNKLVGRTDIEDALSRLDKLTQEEVRVVAAQVLKATRGVGDKVNMVLDSGEETRLAIQRMASGFDDTKRDQLREKLRRWLSPPDPSVNYNTACGSHHEGTAAWFTQGSVFMGWQESGSFLWIHGKPGSGKSILSSAIIQNIKDISETGSAHIAYFFFDFKDTGKQDSRALLSSFLVQLFDQSDSYCDILLNLYSTHRRGSEQPSANALKRCLEDMLKIPQQVPIYLIVDALDECPDNTGAPSSREEVLELVEELVELRLPNLRLCVTSRPEIDIRNVLNPLTPTCVSLHDETGQKNDIVNYVSSVVYSDRKMKRWRDEDKKLVINTLSERAGGMFRWVSCQVETLRRCLVPSVRRTLDELPETLDGTYGRILLEIPKQNQDCAHRLLECLTVAVRPLLVEELAEVLAVGFTLEGIPTLNVDLRWEDQEQAVLSACSSLIAVVEDHDSRVVQFSHFSVREFLTSKRLANLQGGSHYYIHLDSAHTTMAQACLGVLLRLDYSIDKENIKNFPLAHYAAEHWAFHAEFENVMSHIEDGVDYFLDGEKPHFAAWLWMREIVTWGWREDRMRPERPDAVPLYYVAEFGYRGLVERLISKSPQEVNSSRGHRGTPLHVALTQRRLEVSQLLLSHCEDPDDRGAQGLTFLHLACINTCFNIVQWLLDRGVDVNAREDDGLTPLHLAATSGRDYVIRSHRTWCYAPPEPRDEGSAPSNEQLDVIRLLLKHGADMAAQDDNQSSPLHLASYQGQLEAVQLLLECGADVHIRNKYGQTPLHCASVRGYCKTISLLLEYGADVAAQDIHHRTPLHLAVYCDQPEAAQLLLDRGAGVHVRDEEGRTPLHHASLSGHSDTVRLLLEHNVDVDAQDEGYSTPLHLASLYGRLEAAQLLVEHSADVHLQNDKGETPFQVASAEENEEIMRLLSDHVQSEQENVVFTIYE